VNFCLGNNHIKNFFARVHFSGTKVHSTMFINLVVGTSLFASSILMVRECWLQLYIQAANPTAVGFGLVYGPLGIIGSIMLITHRKSDPIAFKDIRRNPGPTSAVMMWIFAGFCMALCERPQDPASRTLSILESNWTTK